MQDPEEIKRVDSPMDRSGDSHDRGGTPSAPPLRRGRKKRWRTFFFSLAIVLLAAVSLFMVNLLRGRDSGLPRIAFIYQHNGTAALAMVALDGSDRENVVVSAPVGLQFNSILNIFNPSQKTALRSYFYADSLHDPVWLAGVDTIGFYAREVGAGCEGVRTVRLGNGESTQYGCLDTGHRGEKSGWSPDGRAFAFVSREGEQSRLTITDSDSRVWAEVVFAELVHGLAWSPDSQAVALTLGEEHGLRLYDQGGNLVSEMQPGLRALARPAWSSDGRWLAYFCSEGVDRLDLCTIAADGSEFRQFVLPDGTPHIKTDLAWSPAGGLLVFSGVMPSGFNDLFLFDPETGDVVRLTSDPMGDSDPAWSADGAWIVFSSNRDGNWELYKIRLDGTDLTRLTDTPGDEIEPAVE